MFSETMMNTPRCGKAETNIHAFSTLNSGWKRNDLTYRVTAYLAESEMPRAVLDDTIAQAFKVSSCQILSTLLEFI